MTRQSDLIRALAHERLYFFMRLSFDLLNPGNEFVEGGYLRAICHALERVHRGEARRLIIVLPPRSLKSFISSIVFPAWVLGHDPTRRIICASYSSDLANSFSFQTRQLMQSALYRSLFPGTILHPKKAAAEAFLTTRNGYRLSTSVGGTLTGKGGDLLLVDDPLKAEDATSEARREAVHAWYSGTLVSRLDDPRAGGIVVVAQRLHQDDLPGRLIAAGGWELLELPAVATRRQTIDVGDRMEWHREPGALLHPERVDQDELNRISREIGSAAYSAQYQQKPVPEGGLLIRTEWFGTYAAPLPRRRYEAVVQSWDTAAVPGLNNDWCVCTTWGIFGKTIHLLDVHRQQHEFTDLIRAAHQLRQKWQPTMIVIEKALSGIDMLSLLYREGWREILQACAPKGDKVQRMSAQTPKLEAGLVHLPQQAPWLDPFLAEVAAFPNAKHDDQVDSMSQFLFALDRRPWQIGKISWYK